MRHLVDRLLQSPRLRHAYYRLSLVPGVRRGLRVASRTLVSSQTRWVTPAAGGARGLSLEVDPRAEMGYLRGDHEPWMQDLLAEVLTPGAGYADIGSHVGFFALIAARTVGPHGWVVAAEPDDVSRARLGRMIERNALTNVQVVGKAVWSHTGTVRFRTSTDTDSGVQGAVASGDDPGAVEVEATTLDDLVHGRLPALIKIDVEGAEVEVLGGALGLIAANESVWIVELHGDELATEVHRVFADAGYTARTISPVHDVYDDYRQEYVVALPAGRPIPRAVA